MQQQQAEEQILKGGYPCGDCNEVFATAKLFSDHVPSCKTPKKRRR